MWYYPFKAYVTISYDTRYKKSLFQRDDGTYEFEVNLIKNVDSKTFNATAEEIKIESYDAKKIRTNTSYENVIEFVDEYKEHSDLKTVVIVTAAIVAMIICLSFIVCCYIYDQYKYNEKVSEIIDLKTQTNYAGHVKPMPLPRGMTLNSAPTGGPSSRPNFDDGEID